MSKSGEYIECLNCGEKFYVMPYRVEGAKYCSRQCQNEYQAKQNWENGVFEKAEREEIKCKFCGDVFTARVNENRKFCSFDCYLKYREENKNPETAICRKCGTEFEYYEPARNGVYCSAECKRTHLKGKWASNWQGGGIECECEICGRKFKIQKSRYKKHGKAKCCSMECLYEWYKNPETMTNIEKEVFQVLEKLEIDFEPQKSIDSWRFDFYLPELNLIIEADGDYWHKRPEGVARDKAKDRWCNKNNYNIEHIWVSDIKEDAEKYVKQAISKYQTNESKVVSL